MEVAVYGLPVRMPHWSFGVRYIYQLMQHRMGHSRLFEVVFPGNPGRAYLAGNNSLQENTLVTAHVLGHADFAKNNTLFRRSQEQVGYRIVEQAATHARQIGQAVEQHGQKRVEQVLDAALSLEAHIDTFQPLRRERYPEYVEAAAARARRSRSRSASTACRAGASTAERRSSASRADLPPAPERDLLWFIAEYAPELEDWERDIFLAVREESFYFYPVFACQIMNEGWASYWHARLLREADFLPQNEYLDAIKTHSDVVRPHAAEQQASLVVNPYHLGFSLWEAIVEEHGIERAFEIRAEDDDFSFVRNYSDSGAGRGAQAVPLRDERPTAACACSITTSTRCARRCWRRSTTSARPPCSPSTSRSTARSSSTTSTTPTAAGSISSGPSACSTTCTRCGVGRSRSRPSTPSASRGSSAAPSRRALAPQFRRYFLKRSSSCTRAARSAVSAAASYAFGLG